MRDPKAPERSPATLDPEDRAELRRQAHRMLDDALDFLEGVPEGPVWRPMPPEIRASFDAPLPSGPSPLANVHEEFARSVLPHGTGNVHPRFFGWVHGGGNPAGMLGEMLAATLNSNLGGRDHAGVEVERQVVRWMRQVFGLPATASGIVVTGSSMANFMGVSVAKTSKLGTATRTAGLDVSNTKLVAYTSVRAHSCVARAMELSGLGSDALRLVPVDADHRMDIAALRTMMAHDRVEGRTPFLIVGTAGTVDVGAFDDIATLADIAEQERLWLHVDGAFGSLCALSPDLKHLVRGLDRADSIACDFHKWMQVPYDAGLLMVRDEQAHRAAFANEPAYLARATRGLAAGSPWFTDFGPELSRGFRALKVWFTMKVYGLDALGNVIAETCRVARDLRDRVLAEPELELMAPVASNIVCFRYRTNDSDRVNDEIVIALQESGLAVPSTTRIDGKLAIRAAIVNHRTRTSDVNLLIDGVLDHGRRLRNG
ncbi:MAG: cytochrome D ubiquinol oxidase subunit I [Polyangiaceae bacterium]|nr:cytochrome D ubiquinol oxidase subunit I [Polyangiaceae bacterium]